MGYLAKLVSVAELSFANCNVYDFNRNFQDRLIRTKNLFQRNGAQIQKNWKIFFICWLDSLFVKCISVYALDIKQGK